MKYFRKIYRRRQSDSVKGAGVDLLELDGQTPKSEEGRAQTSQDYENLDDSAESETEEEEEDSGVQLEASECKYGSQRTALSGQEVSQVLQSWRAEARVFAEIVRPRRPLLLLEVWAVRGTDPRLLGEQWLPYEVARSAGSKGAVINLPLVPRLGSSRFAKNKPEPWPPLDEENHHMRSPPHVENIARHVRICAFHRILQQHDWTSKDPSFELFEFQFTKIDLLPHSVASTMRDHTKYEFMQQKVFVQLWRWGGDCLAASNSDDNCRHSGSSPCSPSVDTSWSMLFQSIPFVFPGKETTDNERAQAVFASNQRFVLKLRLAPHPGVGGGMEDLDDRADPQLVAILLRGKEMQRACTNLQNQIIDFRSGEGASRRNELRKTEQLQREILLEEQRSLARRIEALERKCIWAREDAEVMLQKSSKALECLKSSEEFREECLKTGVFQKAGWN